MAGQAADYVTFYISAAWRLFCLTRRGDILVAKTDPPMFSVVAAAVKAVRGARLINWLQDVFPEVAQALEIRGASGTTARALRCLRDWSLRRAHANVVLSQRSRARVEAVGADTAGIRVIPNWENGEIIKPVAPSANELRREWGLANNFVVGYSGNMGRAHDFSVVLEAAETLKCRPDIAFLWIGDGAQRAWLKQEARRRDLKSFIFKPYQPRERLAESLSVPDLHLISLRPALEGLIFPSKLYGIAAAGRPSLFIGDPTGDVAAELHKHECGYNVGSADGSALARRIEGLSGDVQGCQQMGLRARKAFMSFYDERFAVERWDGLLREIAGLSPVEYPQAITQQTGVAL